MKIFKYPYLKIALLVGIVFLCVMACKKQETNPEKMEETILQGTATVLVDETVQPIIEDQVAVFESQYNAKIKLINKPESEVINLLINNKAQIAVLSRKLSKEEETAFALKNIKPRTTEFATDAIALITSKSSQDTIADLQEVINLMQGKASKIKGLVFENPNSSTVNYMNQLSGVAKGEKKGIYSLKSNEEVLKYISQNPGLIGVVGLNSIVQPSQNIEQYLHKINVMSVRNVKNKNNDLHYYAPTQSNLGAGLYPLQRHLYVLNYQGREGLGMGFASFIAGEIGQRIILKSGLLPIRIPSRNITIRNEIENNKK